MIQSNKALYQKINSVVKVLGSSGNDQFACRLRDALSISTIPSEVLGEVKLVLEDLSKTNLLEKLNIEKDVIESMHYLNKIL